MPASSTSRSANAIIGTCLRRRRSSTGQDPRPSGVSYWKLVGMGEPFRLLFPLGTAIGIFGVALWPWHIWGNWTIWPAVPHARIMMEGFVGAFVAGFLGTALPRLLGVGRFGLGTTLILAAGFVSLTVAHAMGLYLAGDILFLVTMGGLVGTLAWRARKREDVPPPGFVLVLMGLLSALYAAGVWVWFWVAPAAVNEFQLALARLLLYQGYILLPIMGVGAFLLPRFFGLPNRQVFPESRSLPPGWTGRAVFALACGVVVLGGFFVEAEGRPGLGAGLRAAGMLVYFFREVPLHKAGWGGGSLVFGLRVALLSFPVGYALMAGWPQHSMSFLHVVAITGISLVTFVVASRVVLGHSGQAHRFRLPVRSVQVLVWLLVLAMITRVSADWMPTIRLSHYGYAAGSWIVGVLIWALAIFPSVRRPDEEE